MRDSAHDFRLSAIGGVLLFAVTIASLPTNQVLFVGTFSGWITHGLIAVIATLALLPAVGLARGSLVALGLMGATLASPEALPYSFGILLFAAMAMITQAGGPRGKKITDAAITALGVWSLYLLVRWGLGPVTDAYALRQSLNTLAGTPWIDEAHVPSPNQPLGHANYTAGLGILLLPVFAWRIITATDGRSRLLRGCFAAIPLALLIAVGSRAALLAPGVAVAIWIALAPGTKLSRRSKCVIAAATALISLTVVTLHPRFHQWFTAADAQTDSDLVRWDYIVGCWNMFLDSPWLGHGAGAIPLHFTRFAPPDAEQAHCYHAHCTPVQWMAEYGIGGLALFGLIVWATLKALRLSHEHDRRNDVTGFALSAGAYLVFSLFDHQANIPLLGATWGLVLGVSLGNLPPPAPLTPRPRKILKFAPLLPCAMLCWQLSEEAPSRWHAGEALRLKNTDYRAAVTHILQATEVSPDSPALHAIAATLLNDCDRHGYTHKQTEFRTLAEKHWRLADELAPDTPRLKTHRALALLPHEPAAAEALLRESLALAPRQPGAWIALAQATAMQGRTEATTETLALSLLCHPEYYTAPLVRTGRYGVSPESLKARVIQLMAEYSREFPHGERERAVFTRILGRMETWDAANAIPAKISVRESAPSPEESLLKKTAQDDTHGGRAIRAIVKRRHELDIDDRQAAHLLRQYRGEADSPFAGARTLHTEENWGGFGAYLGFAEPLNLQSRFLRDDDLLRAATPWADPIRSARAHREFFAKRLRQAQVASRPEHDAAVRRTTP